MNEKEEWPTFKGPGLKSAFPPITSARAKDHNILGPTAEAAVRDYFERAALLVEDLTDSEDTACLGEADTFCMVALVAQMLQTEEGKRA